MPHTPMPHNKPHPAPISGELSPNDVTHLSQVRGAGGFGVTPLKKAIAVILAFMLLFVSGCESAPQEKKSVKIGVFAYKQSDTFISVILSDLEKAAKEYEQQTGIKVSLDVADAKESQRAQNEQINRAISLNYDVLCVNLVDRTNASPIIDDAMAAGIPIVFFNREPVESDILRGENIYYVGSDAKQTAVLQGEIIVDAYYGDPASIDKNGNGIIEYCMLEGEMGHQDAIIRTEWSVMTLSESNLAHEKIQSGVANWDRNQAAAFVEQWLPKFTNGNIELIICNNDDMALGAADTLARQDISGVAIVGIDATPQGLDAVRGGRLLGTVDCRADNHAKYIFEMAVSLGLNKALPNNVPIEDDRYVRVPLRKITKANVDMAN